MSASKEFTSPFSSTFNSAVRRGTPATTAVSNIANRSGKNTNHVFQSLFKAGQIQRQKFNGQWIYWASQGHKARASVTRGIQSDFWQDFVNWSIASGWVTPEQIDQHSDHQQQFSNFLRKFWNKQFASGSSSSSRISTSTTRQRTTSSHRRTGSTTRTASKARTGSTTRTGSATRTASKARTGSTRQTTSSRRTSPTRTKQFAGRTTTERPVRRAA